MRRSERWLLNVFTWRCRVSVCRSCGTSYLPSWHWYFPSSPWQRVGAAPKAEGAPGNVCVREQQWICAYGTVWVSGNCFDRLRARSKGFIHLLQKKSDDIWRTVVVPGGWWGGAGDGDFQLALQLTSASFSTQTFSYNTEQSIVKTLYLLVWML